MELSKVIGNNIRKCRQAASVSQEELAARIGADQAYVSRLESGQINVTSSTIEQLAEALEVAAYELLKP